MRASRIVGAIAVATTCLISASSRDSMAFCRTTTCPLPPSFSPGPGGCYPENFAADCASIPADAGGPAKVLPLFWRNACVSYDIQKDASRWISYSDAVATVEEAFAKWTQTTCPADAAGKTRVSIQAINLGAVECGRVGYNKDGAPNQHVIVFHDDQWPYDAASTGAPTSASTLGLTTMTFDADTGEIYDADTEINGTVQLSTADPIPSDGFDLPSIITHEMGHFLGLAHSGETAATMFATYSPGSTSMRQLTADDMAGICSIYPPNLVRNVDPSVASNGFVAEDTCSPTPRHGWSSQCDQQPQHGGCTVAPAGGARGTSGALAVVAALLALGAAGRRRRPAACRSK